MTKIIIFFKKKCRFLLWTAEDVLSPSAVEIKWSSFEVRTHQHLLSSSHHVPDDL